MQDCGETSAPSSEPSAEASIEDAVRIWNHIQGVISGKRIIFCFNKTCD